jgi:hypothetical protein
MDKALKTIPVLDADYMQNKIVENRLSRTVRVYKGNRFDNLRSEHVLTHCTQQIVVTTKVWQNSDKRENLISQINQLKQELENRKDELIRQNSAQGPDGTLVAELVAKYFIDMVRDGDEIADYTGVLTTIIDRPDMPKDVNLRDFLPYTGKERVITGSNDSVPLIEEHTARLTPITLELRAFGHKNSLWDVLFNPFWDTERLMQTAATIRVDSRNDDVIGNIVRENYDAGHSQAADTTGATYDLKVYNTVLAAIKKDYNLLHPLFKTRTIGSMNPKLYLLCNPSDQWNLQRVVSGGLVGASGVAQIVSALPLTGIIPYGGGIQHGSSWGKEILSYPGVEKGEFYLVGVTRFGGYTFIKRDLTLETGIGEVLQLSREERAWYRVGKVFLDWLVGKTESSKAYGAIIKGELPAA